MNKRQLHFFIAHLIVFSVACLDRVTKFWALSWWVQPYQVTSFLSFEVAYNDGISWSIGSGSSTLVQTGMLCVIVSLTVLCWCYFMQLLQDGNAAYGLRAYGPALVLGGAVSNLIDRMYYGAVVDFIVVHVGDWIFPIFNVADIAICCGVVLWWCTYVPEEEC